MAIERLLNPTTPLRKSVRVRNLDHTSHLYGEKGVVLKATALRIHVKWDNHDTPMEHPKREDLGIYAESDVNDVLLDYLAAHKEKYEREYAEYRRKREIREREKYAELRREYKAPEFTSQPSYNNEGVEYGYTPDESSYFRRLVEVDLTPSVFMSSVPRFECVNWSCLGTVTPEFALGFAKALHDAATYAIEERARREAAIDLNISADANASS